MSDDDYGYHSDAWDDGGYDEYYDDGYADDGNDLHDYYEADPHSDTGAAEGYSDGVQEEISDGYRQDEPTSGFEGGGNSQKTSGQVELHNFLIESRFYANLFQDGNYDGHSSQDVTRIVSDLK
jgi:hypothetical protein